MLRRDFLRGTVAVGASALLCDWNAKALLGGECNLPKNVVFRDSYLNSKCVFETTGRGRVAFLGGSITEMDGYRPMVCEYLQKKFPQTKFEFVAAGIASTNSDVGAFRLENDVIANRPVDLFFVEFSVNDDQDGMFDYEHSVRGMEGIIRHIRTSCPNVDIVMTFFVNENLMQKYREGSVATSIKAHRAVAERYGISTIDLAKEIQEQIDAKQITWSEFGGVHPAPRGNKICADMIAELFNFAWEQSDQHEIHAHKLPEPLDPYSYSTGRFRGFDGVKMSDGFSVYVPEWSKIPGGFRNTFAGVPCLCAEKPGAEADFEIEGNAVALYVLAGPDAGVVETQIDEEGWKKVNLFHPYSGGLHYPRAVILADALPEGKHLVKIRVSSEKNEKSSGTAVRIMQICVN